MNYPHSGATWGGTSLAEYHLYLLDCDGHILHRSDIEADDDQEALHLVRIRREPSDLLLWCGKRQVARIPRGQTLILEQDGSQAATSGTC